MPAGSKRYLIILFILVALPATIWLFPGSYSVDSIEQFAQVLNGQYTDQNNIILSLIWKFFYTFTGQYYSMYLLQMLLYWSFIYLLLFKLTDGFFTFATGMILAAFMLFIPQYAIADTHIAICRALAVCLILYHYRAGLGARAQKAPMYIAATLIIYSMGMCLTDVLPVTILLYLLMDVASKSRSSYLKKAGIPLTVCMVVIVGVNTITYNVLVAERRYPVYKLMMLDVVGLSKKSGLDYIPAPAKADGYVRDRVMGDYNAASIENFYMVNDTAKAVFTTPVSNAIYSGLKKNWISGITRNSTDYFENRWEGFMYYLKLKKRIPDTAYNTAILTTDPNGYGITKRQGILTKILQPIYIVLSRTVLFTPWFWLISNVFLMIYCVRSFNRKDEPEYRLQVFVQLSAIFSTLTMLFTYQNDFDFRYNYWNIMAACIGLLHCMYLYRKHKKNLQELKNSIAKV